MAQVEYSNLIQVHKSKSTGGDHVQVDHLSLTSRGRHCEQFIFDRFFYMQLVVDDYMLPLPRPLIEDFRFGTDVPDYSYIGAPPGEYGERASEMIKRKSRQVLLFLDVLDVSQDKERQRYKPVFEELSRLGVPLPDAKRIKRNIEGEIRALRLNTNLLTEFRVENLAKELRGRRTEIEASLATIYSTSGAAR